MAPSLFPTSEASSQPSAIHATLNWVHWHNTTRLHSYLNDIPPAEFEAAYDARTSTTVLAQNPA